MNISAPFILRPIATTLLVCAVVLLGGLGYWFLPISPLPAVEFPTIQVTTGYPGASPRVMETSVTTPLEHYFGKISGLTGMSSTSSSGTSEITLQFALSRPIDWAAQDVQAAINSASNWVPIASLPTPPVYRQVNPADTPVLIFALTSNILPLHEVGTYVESVIVPKLSQVKGVGAVTVEGGQRRAVRLEVNPAVLAGLGLSLEDVRRAVAANTTNNPKGSLDGSHQSFQIGANDQLFNAEQYLGIVIAYRNGAPVYLRNVGKTVDSVENTQQAGWYNGRPAIILNIQRQPGANIINVVEALNRLLPKLRADLPPSLEISIVADRTVTIRSAIADVQFTLASAMALVVLVIALFLRRLWATVIPSISLPVSVIATFGVMALLGFSVNNLSLMALTIASGFVVDDAIVMIENITRYVDDGEAPLAAALKGSRQIGFTVISLTVSLIAVFIPLLLMGGVIGRLFHEFAITLSIAVIVSAAVSLTLTPMMCAKFMTSAAARPENAIAGLSERGFQWLLNRYESGLGWVLRHQHVTLLFTLSTIILTVWLYVAIPKGFLPQQDTGLIIAVTDGPADTSFANMSARQRALGEIIARDKDVISVASFVGADTTNHTLSSGRLYINIGSPDRRAASAEAIMKRLLAATANEPGTRLHLQSAQDIRLETRLSRTQYQYVLQDLDEDELRTWTNKLLAALGHVREIEDPTSDLQDQAPHIELIVDRQIAARYGITMAAIDQTLYDAFGQRQIATIYSVFDQYHVVLEATPAIQQTPDILDRIFVTAGTQASNLGASTNGLGLGYQQSSAAVPLSTFTKVRHTMEPVTISHFGLFPAATISFNLPTGVSLSQATTALLRVQDSIGLPEAITTTLVGTAAEFTSSQDGAVWLILAAIVTVYIVLGVLYESFIHPITILSTLPSAGVGALLALMATGQDLNIISLIGIILLIGIVKKNAIMMVDFAIDAERTEGASAEDAIYRASILRFRPIMMTTMAALLGALPLALQTGTGSELRYPLGVAVVGGLVLSQFLTLYSTPVIYLFLDRLQRRMRRATSLGAANSRGDAAATG
ncbi:efflux RND transporter permease subunit [Bradyrhizobium ontarionense]|uniref:Efflux RND transporter permease subunit n=1 Tax=Bradyrhizobium ontarionense TaxID=2898149 RepID=A0ABY3R7I6_9BRAD|nr:efflux RND transporter permease subunit [Bradyrhizobium sp. A19]UFZ03295.1 efflux RND transporter permease subunit [Bradyrhizobium sp. A19]